MCTCKTMQKYYFGCNLFILIHYVVLLYNCVCTTPYACLFFRSLRLAIRISSGEATDTFMGNVEVNFDKAEKWQRLTSKSWTMREAEVVCREIGYEKALEYINETNYERRMDKDINSTIFRKSDENPRQWNGNCTGKEYSILRCNGGETVNELSDKGPSFGVGVRCKIPGKNHHI